MPKRPSCSTVSPRIRLQTQTLVGILVKHIGDRLLITHFARTGAHSLKQHAKFALDTTDLVYNRFVHSQRCKVQRRDLVPPLCIAEGNHGEPIFVVVTPLAESSRDAVSYNIELFQVLVTVLLPADLTEAGWVAPWATVDRPSKETQYFQSWQRRQFFLHVRQSSFNFEEFASLQVIHENHPSVQQVHHPSQDQALQPPAA